MKILLLSKYSRLGASSRVRSYQYLPYLQDQGFQIESIPLFDDSYILSIYKNRVRPTTVIARYLDRLRTLISSRSKFDLVWVEKEVFPWLPFLFDNFFLPRSTPLVVDYDDAIFHHYDLHRSSLVRKLLGGKLDRVMGFADLVIVGNEYLANRARSAGAKNIEILPTVVDTTLYQSSSSPANSTPIIGWIGTPKTSKYLGTIEDSLSEVIRSFGARFVAIGANTQPFTGIQTELIPWKESTEVREIQNFDIGIMPIPDEPFERGKCGYKLIQYMACGKPVIASPVGANSTIVTNSIDGFLPFDSKQWTDSLTQLLSSPDLRAIMGEKGRLKVERSYCLQATAPRLRDLFASIAS